MVLLRQSVAKCNYRLIENIIKLRDRERIDCNFFSLSWGFFLNLCDYISEKPTRKNDENDILDVIEFVAIIE